MDNDKPECVITLNINRKFCKQTSLESRAKYIRELLDLAMQKAADQDADRLEIKVYDESGVVIPWKSLNVKDLLYASY